MPLIYSHLRFGKKCIETLPEEYKNIVKNNLTYFNYGTQGPDILYYHSPFTNKKFIQLADLIHKNGIANTLKNTKQIFLNNKNRDIIISYILGYISHFLLDSYCNNYLNKASTELKISTNQLIKEIDRYYLYKDKIDKPSTILNEFKTSDNTNKIMSLLLKINEKDIKQARSNFITYIKLLIINNKYLLFIVSKILLLLKHKDYLDLFIYNNPEKHTAQIIRIEKYTQIAVLHYELLVNNFLDYLFIDNDLDSYYFNSFENTNNIIEVLSIDEEKKYIIKEFMK